MSESLAQHLVWTSTTAQATLPGGKADQSGAPGLLLRVLDRFNATTGVATLLAALERRPLSIT
jgi:hypothetical protein